MSLHKFLKYNFWKYKSCLDLDILKNKIYMMKNKISNIKKNIFEDELDKLNVCIKSLSQSTLSKYILFLLECNVINMNLFQLQISEDFSNLAPKS